MLRPSAPEGSRPSARRTSHDSPIRTDRGPWAMSRDPPDRPLGDGGILPRPIEGALLPDVKKSGQHEPDEDQHFDKCHHLEITINHHPGIEKDRLDIEKDEQ